MRKLYSAVPKFIPILVFLSLFSPRVFAQATNAQPRITVAVNDAQTTVLRGNTHPLARAEFDRGAAPAALPMQHMLMVLQRSPAQETALESFMAEQMDRSSPNYHHWLTPTEFGQLYGPAEQDIDTVTKWLTLHGFQVENVAAGRTTIQFSGTVGQVQTAFHTSIHEYVVKGEQHWANSIDPSIPTALTPVVAGIRSLHNFNPKPAYHTRRTSSASLKPSFTFNSGQQSCDIAGVSPLCFTVGPNDFATIYNLQQLWSNGVDGTGETIAVMADSDINLNDVAQFRALFNLPANVPRQVYPTGTSPGKNNDEIEAALDTEWSGAIAKGATIALVASPSTNTTFGGDTSAQYVINCQVASPNCTHGTVPAKILSESFGECELGLSSSSNPLGAGNFNNFYNTEWQQAAAEGITVLISSGDNGSAGCDIDEVNGPITQPATNGLQVNGLASTPYNVAVGGTDFNDIGFETTGGPNGVGYWNPAPGTQSSALSYIPETTWNDTCTNPEVILLAGVANAVASCSNETVQQNGLVEVTGGSGGASDCITITNNSVCSGGYPKPCFQLSATTASCNSNQIGGVVTPNDGARDLPDVSLFAGDGLAGSFYVMCELDTSTQSGLPGTGQNNTPCALGASPVFVGVGGTSVSVQAFAGIMALVDQQHGPQGNADLAIYKLFASQNNANCASNAPGMGSAPAPGCIFNDVTVGAGGATATNSMPCKPGTPDCSTTVASLPWFPSGRSPQINVRAVRIACALGIGLFLLLGLRRRTRRWATADGDVRCRCFAGC